MAELKVHTAQNVLLEFPVGNIGQRLLAAIIDLMVCALYVFIANLVISRLLSIDIDTSSSGGILSMLVGLLPVIFYFPISEYFWNGRTVGKYFMKLKVVSIDGTSPSLGDYILRWLIRTIDVKLGFLLIFFIPRSPSSQAEEAFLIWAIILTVIPMPLVGFISMGISKTSQRLGDRVANTVVIVSKRPFSLADTILKTTEVDYKPRFLNALKLSDKDIYIIKKVLDDVVKTGDYKHIKQLAEKAKEMLEIQEDIKPLVLLQTLLNDYNYLAKERDQPHS